MGCTISEELNHFQIGDITSPVTEELLTGHLVDEEKEMGPRKVPACHLDQLRLEQGGGSQIPGT